MGTSPTVAERRQPWTGQSPGPGGVDALAAPGVSVLATPLPRFLASVSAMTQPAVLVLDNLELLGTRPAAPELG